MKIRFFFIVVLMIAAAISLTGCVPGDGVNTAQHPAGFFWGIWHGWLAPISLVIGLFKSHIRIYEIHNRGWWYDMGYYVAVISGFGGISFSRRRKHHKHHKSC